MKSLKMMAAVAAAVAIFGANAIGDDRVAGESLDSGLGSLTREDLEQYMPAQMLRTALDR